MSYTPASRPLSLMSRIIVPRVASGKATEAPGEPGAGNGRDKSTDDPAAVVDVGRDRVRAVGSIDRRDHSLMQQEAVRPALRIDILADDLTLVVDAEGLGPHRAWDGDRGEDAVVPQEPVGQFENRCVGVIAVRADDLALRVPVRENGRLRAWEVDGGEAVVAMDESMQSPALIDIPAHNRATVIDAEDCRKRADTRRIDGGEDAVLGHKSMAPDGDIGGAFAVGLPMLGAQRF